MSDITGRDGKTPLKGVDYYTDEEKEELISEIFFDNIGNGLYIDDFGKVSVETTDVIEQDNTKPVTSATVYTVCGNIESLLSII